MTLGYNQLLYDLSCVKLLVVIKQIITPSFLFLFKCLLILVVLCFSRFSKRDKSQDRGVVKQGIPAPDAPMAAPEKLPAALQKGPTLFPVSLAEPHIFILPRNTAGEAKLKGRSQPPAISQAPPSHQRLPVIAPAIPVSLPVILPHVQFPTVVNTSSTGPGTSQVMFFNIPLPSAMPPSAQTQTSSQAVPYSTQQYRKRKQMREDTGTVTRKYVRKTDVILCRKCNKERKAPSHLQYFGNWYCEETETQSYAEWRAVLEERGYRKKKKGNDNPPAP